MRDTSGRAKTNSLAKFSNESSVCQTRNYLQPYTDTDLPEAMDDKDEWGGRVRKIPTSGVTRWWWWYCHPQTNSFVILWLFRVARCFKLESKPGWHYVSRTSYPKPSSFSAKMKDIYMCIFLRERYRLPGELNSGKKYIYIYIYI